ncbi:MAG: hypothetical protein DA330_10095, partial [Nitrososphaera sp.]|nr:hypothetical protein [Nitrososphaera sp.]
YRFCVEIAHTAEHAFIGALQKILGRPLLVRKVEHGKDSNTAFIVIPELKLETIIAAETMVNELIFEGRQVTTRSFPSLEEAKKSIPGLRANEQRISGEVRVVEIENHDASACALEHAVNLSQCDFFLVTRLSKKGNEYEVDFVVGQKAKQTAVSISAKLLKVCEELGANLNTIENTARKVKLDSAANLGKLKTLSGEKLAQIQPLANGEIQIFTASFSNLADDKVIEFAGEKITSPKTAVVISNAGLETAFLVVARSNDLSVDLAKIFKEAAGPDGRGGGKPHFVTGIVNKEKAGEIVDSVSKAILSGT